MKFLILVSVFLIACSSNSYAKASLDYNDAEAMKTEIKNYNLSVLRRLGDNLKKDKKFMLDVVAAEFFPILKVVDPSLMKDREFVLKLVALDGNTLDFADTSLKKDKDVVLAAIFKNKKRADEYAFEFSDASLKKDKSFILSIISRIEGPTSILKFIDNDLKQDKSFILKVFSGKDNGFLYTNLTKKMKKDRDICALVLKSNAFYLDYMGDEIKDDKALMLNLFSQHDGIGEAFQFVSNRLKKDKDVVLAAVTSRSLALKYAHPSLTKDKDIALAAAKKHESEHYSEALLFELLDPSLRNDKDIRAIFAY